jgi:primosomal protein N' (replication factor Y)
MTPDSDRPGSADLREVAVLLPYALPGPYSYLSEADVGKGDYVLAPLGPRNVIGVVWGEGTGEVAREKLRPIAVKFDAPPMPAVHREFIDWVAAYTMAAPGAVLRMVLRVPEALGAARERLGVRRGGPLPPRMTEQRQRVIEVAGDDFAWPIADLAEEAGVSPGVVRGLVDCGTLEACGLPAMAPFDIPDSGARGPDLSDEQRDGADRLRAAQRAGVFSVTLLDGVTGSGKTEVYLEMVAEALAQGRQVLVLLPEIALTGQFIERIEARFGSRPAEWHSAVGPRERERVWRGIADGTAPIVVGARSALFLPFADLGLIVVDEEHESAFKQEDGVHYHARDMAIVRASLGQIPIVLSSATPSLETLYNVDRGRYGLVTLADRHGVAELPEIGIIDMRKAEIERGKWLSVPLREAVAATLEAGEQALLFLNRRGYAPLTLCRTCGFRLQCPNCDAWLVEHRFRRHLLCHHCGHQAPIPEACPSCGAEDSLVACGPGVERLAEEVAPDFGAARIAVLSSDLMRGEVLRTALAAMAAGEIDLAIGTQLVAKGHHFPGLTLVGVVDADFGLGTGDPRAGEHTYQLLRQVAGRAGRAEKPGRALIQTYQPENPLMQALLSGDPATFYAHEHRARELAGLPPYGRLAGIVVTGSTEGQVADFARALSRAVPAAEHVRVLGPAPAPIAFLRGRHRVRFLVKSIRDFNMQDFVRRWLDAGPRPRGDLRLTIDIDPQSFM